MINLFHKIAILKHINANKDKVKYSYKCDIADFTEIHKTEIDNKDLVAISMFKNTNNDSILFYLEYNLHENNESSYKLVKPDQQSFFDTFFISKMYKTMFNNYTVKNNEKIR